MQTDGVPTVAPAAIQDLATTSLLLHPEKLEASELRRFAEVADAAGFHAVLTVDAVSADSSVFNHEVLASSSRLLSGSCVAARWKRHPMLLAQNLAALDHLHPGRVSVGIGSAAWMADARTAWAAPLDRGVARMSEYVDIVKAALASGEVDVDGQFYAVRGEVSPHARHRVPVSLAAGGPKMARLAGSKADGMFVQVGSTARISGLTKTARLAAERAGRDPEAFHVNRVVHACVGKSRAVASNTLRTTIAGALEDHELLEIVSEYRSADAAQAAMDRRVAGDLDDVASALPEERRRGGGRVQRVRAGPSRFAEPCGDAGSRRVVADAVSGPC